MKPWRTPSKVKKETGKAGIQASCVGKARRRKWWARKFVSPAQRSVPDFVLARLGLVFWVEFKAPGKKPTDQQQEEIDLMLAAGLTVYVVDNVAEFGTLLDRYDAEQDWLL